MRCVICLAVLCVVVATSNANPRRGGSDERDAQKRGQEGGRRDSPRSRPRPLAGRLGRTDGGRGSKVDAADVTESDLLSLLSQQREAKLGKKPTGQRRPKAPKALCYHMDHEGWVQYDQPCPAGFECLETQGLKKIRNNETDVVKTCQPIECDHNSSEEDGYNRDCGETAKTGEIIKCSKENRCEYHVDVKKALGACEIDPPLEGVSRPCYPIESTVCDCDPDIAECDPSDGEIVELDGSQHTIWYCSRA